MLKEKNRLILIAIGNSARSDDGLAWEFLDIIQNDKKLRKAKFIYCYQLNIEDAELITNAHTVVFIDAFYDNLTNGCSFDPCKGENHYEFTTHALSPGVIVSLCSSLYGINPRCYLLKIQGVDWELKEGISEQAKQNLLYAVDEFRNTWITNLKQPFEESITEISTN
jgi:hydrogenase maturation protease